jgi:G3E family GTPase
LSGRTPVTVAGGYLGAGKTTLVNHLLRHAQGMRLAVLVNDFGDLAIDADLIEAQSGDVVSIAGGCVCCSFGSDLIGTLMTLAGREPAPDQFLIETSGVALPGAVARSVALLPSLSIDSVVVLADAETVRVRATDQYMGDTILRQLAEADLVVLNKVDLVDAGTLAGLRSWLEEAAPRARVIESVRAQVPPALLFGRGHDPAGPWSGPSPGTIPPLAPAAAVYESESFALRTPLDVAGLAGDLAQPGCGLVRAKGVLRDADGSLKTLHVVGARFEVSAFGAPAEAGTGLACIGLSGRLDRGAIKRAIVRATRDVATQAAGRTANP